MELQYLGKGADSVVFRKGNTDRVLKLYEERAVNSSDYDTRGNMNEDKVKFYHSLQNRFAGNIYGLYLDSGDAKWAYFKQYIKTITFEILGLDCSKIAKACGIGELQDKNFITAEVDYIKGKSLKDIHKTKFKHYHTYISFQITRQLVHIMGGTQLSQILSQEVMSGYGIDPYNMKYEIKSQNIHLIITDTLNNIGLLIA